MTNHPNRKMLDTDDLIGSDFMYPVTRKFKKGAFDLSTRDIEFGYHIDFVVDWEDQIIRVACRHGRGNTMREFKGGEWACGWLTPVDEENYVEDFPLSLTARHRAMQEDALAAVRMANSFLENCDVVTDEVKAHVVKLMSAS